MLRIILILLFVIFATINITAVCLPVIIKNKNKKINVEDEQISKIRNKKIK